MRALIVDDEKNIRSTLSMCLEGLGWEVTAAASGDAALEAVGRQIHEIAFVDVRLGAESGLDLLPRLLAASPGLSVVMITAYATVDSAVEAIKRGAADYLPKPFTPSQVRHIAERVAEQRRAERRIAELEQVVADVAPEVDLSTASPRMQLAIDTAVRAAASEAPVLLRGESGTGKGVLARLIHQRSPRAGGPLAVVNCPTLSEDLLASELFGHARGAFTGAVRDERGRVEAAAGGTLFLDEIGEITPSLQAKLLRFLQDRTFERVGETATRRADVRVVAATNRDLEADVREGRFREDLLYRLNVVEIVVPPLRERPEDVLPMGRRMLATFARAAARRVPELAPETERALAAYAWPGNVRELRNVTERIVILWPGDRVTPEALPQRIVPARGPGPQVGGDVTLEELEHAHILSVLRRTATQEEAARILGIDVSTLWRKRKRYGDASE